jgi:uncharacterized FlaG/YvyC family protein
MSTQVNPALGAQVAPNQPQVLQVPMQNQSRSVQKPSDVDSQQAPLIDMQELRESLQVAVEKLNEQVQKNGRGLNFAIDEVLNRPIITVRNTSTGEVVRQIPSEVILKVAHDIEHIKGLLMDENL